MVSKWIYYYNVRSKHYGYGSKRHLPPFERLKKFGYNLDKSFACFKPVILDKISSDIMLYPGHDLYKHYQINIYLTNI